MKRSTLSMAFYVLLVFLSGGVVGGFAHRLYMLNSVAATGPASPKLQEWRSKYLDEMHTRLSLNDAQLTQLGEILDTTKVRLDALKSKWEKESRDKARPEMKTIQDERLKRVNQILTDAQRAEYEKLRAEWNQQREKNRKAKQSLPRGD